MAPAPEPPGRHRGRRPGDDDYLEYHHGVRYIPRHAEARLIPRCLPRELTWHLIETTT